MRSVLDSLGVTVEFNKAVFVEHDMSLDNARNGETSSGRVGSPLMTVEFSEIKSWPNGAAEFVDAWIGANKSLDDVNAADEAAFRLLFTGASVRAYHCARYLKHEVESIRTNGLRVAAKSLFDERASRAAEAAEIEDAFRDQLIARHALAGGDDSPGASGRFGKTCFALPRSYLNSRLGAAEHAMGGFLLWWGGEAVFTACSDAERQLLRIGRPTIVVCSFEIAKWLQQQSYVSLLGLCIRIRRGEEDAASQINWHEPISAEAIETIWHPGDAEYDALDKLPRG